MDLEKAYNKVDNLCCLNHNVVTITNIDIDHGRVPKKIDFFEGYNETKDDDFCKDANEMMEALETIKSLVDLQKKFECPLYAISWLFQNKPILVLNPVDGFLQVITNPMKFYNFDRKAFDIRCENFVSTYSYKGKMWETGGVIVYLKDYGKTWWLKEDKSS